MQQPHDPTEVTDMHRDRNGVSLLLLSHIMHDEIPPGEPSE